MSNSVVCLATSLSSTPQSLHLRKVDEDEEGDVDVKVYVNVHVFLRAKGKGGHI